MKKFLKNKKGFTLIELIIVVAILAVLAAIAIPKFSSFKDSAEDARDKANEDILYKAASLYLAEEGNPGANEEWDADDTDPDWGKYIDEWPTHPTSGQDYVVTIDTDGDIVVTHEAED